MPRKILVAYDGSDFTQNILEEAKSQAQGYPDAEIHLIAVVTQMGPATHPGVSLSIQKDMAEKMRSQMKEVAESYTDSNIKLYYDAIVDESQRNAGHKIVEYAEEQDIDIIVIGNRGLGNVQSIFLGSVSSQVLQHASCNVLVVK